MLRAASIEWIRYLAIGQEAPPQPPPPPPPPLPPWLKSWQVWYWLLFELVNPLPQTPPPSASLTARHPAGRRPLRIATYPLASASSAFLLTQSSFPNVGSWTRYLPLRSATSAAK